MKTFLFKLATFFGVIAVALGVVFAVYTKKYPPEKSFYMASADKHRRLETLPSPRIIFIAGSSMAFGMDSGLVGERLGLNPVNMGLNAAVGLEFMLQEVEPFLRRGDVVVLAPEYLTFETYYRPLPEYVARLIECRPTVLRALTFQQLKELLDDGYKQHVGRVIRNVLGKSEGILEGGAYVHNHRGAFNQNGDIITHHGLQGPQLGVARFKYTGAGTTEIAIEHVNWFADAARQRGARVFYSHPPYEQRSYEKHRAAIHQLDELLRARLHIPRLDAVEDMVFPTDHFFDTEYHLNLEGKLKRSERVAANLARALAEKK